MAKESNPSSGEEVIDQWIALLRKTYFLEDDPPLEKSQELKNLIYILGLQKLISSLSLDTTETKPAAYIQLVGELAKKNQCFVIMARELNLHRVTLNPKPSQEAVADVRGAVVYSFLLDRIAHSCMWEPKPSKKRDTLLSDLVATLDLRMGQSAWQEKSDLFEHLKIKTISEPIRNMCLAKAGGHESDLYFQQAAKPDNGEVLSLSILSAMYEDFRLDNSDNANAGFELMVEPFGRSPIPGTGSDVNREWVHNGQPMGVWLGTAPFPVDWNCLYQSWNLGFCSNYSNSPYFFAKLLNPTVMGTYFQKGCEGLYMWPRLLCLFVHTRYEAITRNGNRTGVNWTDKHTTLVMGSVNLKLSAKYQVMIKQAVLDKVAYKLKRGLARAFWQQLQQAIQTGSKWSELEQLISSQYPTLSNKTRIASPSPKTSQKSQTATPNTSQTVIPPNTSKNVTQNTRKTDAPNISQSSQTVTQNTSQSSKTDTPNTSDQRHPIKTPPTYPWLLSIFFLCVRSYPDKCNLEGVRFDYNQHFTEPEELSSDENMHVHVCLQSPNKSKDHESHVYIAFQGTDNAANVLTDLKIDKVLIDFVSGSEVHRGFYEELDRVYQSIRNHRWLQNKNSRIYLTGHSLGGALATLCAYRLYRDGLRHLTVVNFGSPPIGNWEWVRLFRSTSITLYRVVNNCDIADSEAWKYKHINSPILLKTKRWWCNPITSHWCASYYHTLRSLSERRTG